MKTFLLLATLWGTPQNPDAVTVEILDYGLTGEDCTTAVLEKGGITPAGYILSCELDIGQLAKD